MRFVASLGRLTIFFDVRPLDRLKFSSSFVRSSLSLLFFESQLLEDLLLLLKVSTQLGTLLRSLPVCMTDLFTKHH